MNSILESFKRIGKGLVIDYMRIGIICYFIVSLIFLYVYMN